MSPQSIHRSAPRRVIAPPRIRNGAQRAGRIRALLCALTAWAGLIACVAQTPTPLPGTNATGSFLFRPLGIPQPGPTNDAPYSPQPILPGGIVIPLYPADSPAIKQERAREAEQYNMSKAVPGRISSIVNIHNPSIEVHPVEGGLNTGAAVILAAGGGHNTLNVGGESADFVPYFFNYGVNTVILRNRLRKDGYNVQADAVRDALQAIRLVRAHAKEWNIDPNKIGIMGFSAGAELAAPAAIFFADFDKTNSAPGDALAGVSSRPDFVGVVYPGPTPFARGASPPIPRNVPPVFITCAGSGDRIHALWANELFAAMLKEGVPNVEMHIYGNGRHPGDALNDGSRMSGGLTYRNGMPFGTWQDRYIDWFRDLGFLQKPGVETKAAKDIAAYVSQPPRPMGSGGGAFEGGLRTRPTNAPTASTPGASPPSKSPEQKP
ncbi:MAG: alpha/beta hydrolase fold domain-containing protein [Verrucomicrobia bacterium]|nr:alpha/beta hydrolase fold domain-containing protein [Verrucomicrobiota bacterium]MBI3866931.1 alpha/beta hydrolase fold domain-containing protein [Verrucomicrobiota bacterium]